MVDGCAIYRVWHVTRGDPEAEADAHYRGAHVAPDGSLVASARDAQHPAGHPAGKGNTQRNGTEDA